VHADDIHDDAESETAEPDRFATDLGDDLDDPDRRLREAAPETPTRRRPSARPRETTTGVDPIGAKPAQAPRPLPAGHVELSALTDDGMPVRLTLAFDHVELPGLLARRGTRVRRLSPGVVLRTVAHPAVI
jgi:hypothetical protein